MSLSIQQLRRGVVASASVLVLVLAGFLGLAKLKGHRFHFDLPGRLGVNVSQTANGFTYSQSEKGHTLFTIHASKLVQFKADQAQLHDVTITLYGPDGSGRTDKIYGSDFVYDRKQGVVRADGAVQIDFASPAIKNRSDGHPAARPGSVPEPAPKSAPGAAGAALAETGAGASTIHVTTSGVSFSQATGEAMTDQRVDFAFTRASGSAIGASFNSRTGVLVLGRDVALISDGTLTGGANAIVHAEHAQLLREAHQAYLIHADSVYNGEHTTSDEATVTFRPDGSAEHIDARGHVRLTTSDGAQAHASSALIDLNAQSQPVVANLGGGVTYNSSGDGETMQGSAVTGTLSFVTVPAAKANKPRLAGEGSARPGAQGPTVQALHHAQFRDAVTFVLQRSSLAGDPNGSSTREMRASQLDVDFAPDALGKAEAQHALAVGGAAVKLHDIPAKAPARTTTISGDQLLATFADGRELRVLDGKGNTSIVDSAQDGAASTSTGDTLHVTFAPVRGAPDSHGGRQGGSAQVDTAVQSGNVAMTQKPAQDAKDASGAPQAPMHATAAHAEYHAADQVLHLTGDPHLRNDTLAVAADRVDYHRDSGDAMAIGNVKATYVQQAGAKGPAPTLGCDGPVHIVADHAQMTRANNLSIFYGSPAAQARMWQGGDAVSAPVLELGRDQQTLDAHGAAGERGAVVHATLGARSAAAGAPVAANARVTAANGANPAVVAQRSPAAQGGGGQSARSQMPARLSAVTLHYSDKDRRADLHGSVVAEQATGVVHADQAQVLLTPNVAGKPSAVDRMVATSHVVITQPGRRGTGDRLVYTATDGRYVLTGSPGQPPRVTDAEKGTTTGAALIFRGPDDSVEVSDRVPDGGPAGAPAAHAVRTVTDTHSPK